MTSRDELPQYSSDAPRHRLSGGSTVFNPRTFVVTWRATTIFTQCSTASFVFRFFILRANWALMSPIEVLPSGSFMLHLQWTNFSPKSVRTSHRTVLYFSIDARLFRLQRVLHEESGYDSLKPTVLYIGRRHSLTAPCLEPAAVACHQPYYSRTNLMNVRPGSVRSTLILHFLPTTPRSL